MSSPANPIRNIGLSAFAGLLGLLLLALSLAPTHAEPSITSWLAEMEAYFEANPQLKEQASSGWKPYNRVKWFVEQRLDGGEYVPAGALEALVEEKARREAGSMPDRSWFATGPLRLSGRILDIEFHPTNTDLVYVGSASGGLWISEDNGLTWTTTTDHLPTLEVGAVCVLPWNPDVILLGSGEGNGAGKWGLGVLKSTDAGQTWSETSLVYGPLNHNGYNCIEANPTTHTILAASRDGLWRSTDDGDNWTEIDTGIYYDVKWQPGNPMRVYAAKGNNGIGNGVKVSNNDGITFSQAGIGQPDQSLIGHTRISVTPDDPNALYANYVNRTNSQTLGVYRSMDGGNTWEVRNSGFNMTGGQGWYNLTMMADPNDVDRVLMGGVALYASDNGALSLGITGGPGGVFNDSLQVHVDHHAIAYEPGSDSNVWVGSDGGVWRSTDDGHTWTPRNHGLVCYQFYDIGVAQSHPTFMMGGTQDNGIPGRDGTSSWFPSTLYADGMVCNVNPINDGIVYSEWQFGNHVKSFNGGVNWFSIMNGITGNGAWVAPVDLDQNNVNTLFTATTAGIFRTTTGGNVWEQVTSGLTTWLSINWVDSDVIWGVYVPGARLSTDGGDTWNWLPGWTFPHGSPTKIYAHPTRVQAAFVTFSAYTVGNVHVTVTWDQGETWQDVSGDLPSMPVNAIVVDKLIPSDWYIGTDLGVWRSRDGGATWLPYETGLPNVVVTDLEINHFARKLVAGTYGRGAWEIDLPDPTAADEPWNPAALHLMLDAPYPNPASGSTTLRFAARDVGGASLDIFDVRGRLVDHVTKVRSDGIIRTINWSPRGQASGTYFAVLQTGEERISRKLIIRR